MKTISLTHMELTAQPELFSREDAFVLLLCYGAGKAGEKSFQENMAALIPPGESLDICAGQPGTAVEVIAFSRDLPLPGMAASESKVCCRVDLAAVYTNYLDAGVALLQRYTHISAAVNTLAGMIYWITQQPTAAVCEEQTKPHAHRLVEQAREIIHREFANDLSLQSVAAELFVNPCYLSTVFHQITQTTFRAYLKKVRLQHVCRLLEQSNHLISDIAIQTGFNSTAYLISSFRKEYGTTPNVYRAANSGRKRS